MAYPDHPKVRPWQWNPHRDHMPGARIDNGRGWVFVPVADLYAVADALVAIAEANDGRGDVHALKAAAGGRHHRSKETTS